MYIHKAKNESINYQLFYFKTGADAAQADIEITV